MFSLNLLSPAPLAFAGRKKAPQPPATAPAEQTPPAPTPNKAVRKPPVKKTPPPSGPPATPFDTLKINETEVIVFDIETTGLLPRADKPKDPVPADGYDDVTELSAIKYKNGQETGRFYSLVKPNKRIPREVEEKTNITNELVEKDGKPIQEVMSNFFKFIGKQPIMIGHNAKWFDTKFLRAVCERYKLPETKERLQYDHVVDTKILAQKLFPDCVWTKGPDGKGIPPTPGPDSPKDLKLTTLAEFFGFDTAGAHRAENDVAMAAKVLSKMIELIKAKGIAMETFGDLYKYQFKPRKS